MGSVLFRVESGVGVGLGHLQRCVALATGLAELRHKSIFLSSGGAHSLARIEHAGFLAIDLSDITPGSETDAKFTLAAIADHQSDAIVTDSYLLDQEYMRIVSSSSAALVAIDDLIRKIPPARIIVNTTIDADGTAYGELHHNAQLLMGIEYALLSPPYWELTPRKIANRPRRLLMTLGGADTKNLTPILLTALDDVDAEFDVDVIIGPFNVHHDQIEEAAHACVRTVRLITGQESLHKHISSADIAISAAGQTLYELAATGTPTVAIQVTDNQALNTIGFSGRGCIEPVLASNSHDIVQSVVGKITELINNPKQRVEMSAAGQRLVDGQGARRVAQVIDQIL